MINLYSTLFILQLQIGSSGYGAQIFIFYFIYITTIIFVVSLNCLLHLYSTLFILQHIKSRRYFSIYDIYILLYLYYNDKYNKQYENFKIIYILLYLYYNCTFCPFLSCLGYIYILLYLYYNIQH